MNLIIYFLIRKPDNSEENQINLIASNKLYVFY